MCSHTIPNMPVISSVYARYTLVVTALTPIALVRSNRSLFEELLPFQFRSWVSHYNNIRKTFNGQYGLHCSGRATIVNKASFEDPERN